MTALLRSSVRHTPVDVTEALANERFNSAALGSANVAAAYSGRSRRPQRERPCSPAYGGQATPGCKDVLDRPDAGVPAGPKPGGKTGAMLGDYPQAFEKEASPRPIADKLSVAHRGSVEGRSCLAECIRLVGFGRGHHLDDRCHDVEKEPVPFCQGNALELQQALPGGVEFAVTDGIGSKPYPVRRVGRLKRHGQGPLTHFRSLGVAAKRTECLSKIRQHP